MTPRHLILGLFVGGLLLAQACGSSDEEASNDNGSGKGGSGGKGSAGKGGGSGKGGSAGQSQGGASGKGGTTGGGGQVSIGGQAGTSPGGAKEPCGQSGVKVAGACCEPALRACSTLCCPDGQVCSFEQCRTPGPECAEAEDCGEGFYCEYSLGNLSTPQPGCVGATGKGRCLPRPPLCQGPSPQPGCIQACEVKSDGSFALVERATLPGSTLMTPLVIQTDDDNCNGKLDPDDIPEIIYAPGYDKPSPIEIKSFAGGKVVDKRTIPDAVRGASSLAAGDLDGDGIPEIVGIGPKVNDSDPPTVVAYHAKDGSLAWKATLPDAALDYEAPAIADPFKNGKPVVLVNFTLINGQNGAVLKKLGPPPSAANGEAKCKTGGGYFFHGPKHTFSSFADLDGDGTLDVTDGARAFRVDGTSLWDFRSDQANDNVSGYHAVADLDGDGVPEVIWTGYGQRSLNVAHIEAGKGKMVRAGVKLDGYDGKLDPASCERQCTGGGPPTVADLNGDGSPDVGVAGAIGYIAFDGKKLMDAAVDPAQTVLWSQPIIDCSSAFTGSSVFDFDGDGKAEVVYADEKNLRVYRGSTGEQLIPDTTNKSSTVAEMPVVADVDNDGQADLLLANQLGVHIFASPTGSWVRTRRVWNQHTYHITNINEDGTIPANELPNWKQPGLNNFRQNKQPGVEFLAPDLTIELSCKGGTSLVATVRNAGQAPAPAGAVVEFFAGPAPGTSLGTASTTVPLKPLEAQEIKLDKALPNGTAEARATVSPGATKECRSDNNAAQALCSTIN